MKKRYSLAVCLVFFAVAVQAQRSGSSLLYKLVSERRSQLKETLPVSLFVKTPDEFPAKIASVVSDKVFLKLDEQQVSRLYTGKPASISLQVPFKNYTRTLELIQQDINTTGEFSYGSIEKDGIAMKAGIEQGLHYRGYVDGETSSIASFSIFANGDVMGLFSNSEGNFNIGRIGGSGKYILYGSNDMIAPLGFECATSEIPVSGINKGQQGFTPTPEPLPTLLCKKVRIYWEADYKLYSNNFASDLDNTTNYLKGLFNQVATMYQNEGILIELTDLYTWTTADPYITSTSSNGLNTFKSRWNGLGDTFKADLALLIDGAPTNNGGIAYLLTNDLCNRFYAYGYADIYASYNTVPTYSWDVEVLTHEMGHMMGSNHTHWCGWNTGAGGTCGAIDDCYTTEGYGSCSSCAATTSTNPTPPPGFTGTVMSYCHLRSGIGINLANGFGPLPQAAIRNTVNIAACAVYDNKWTGAVSTAWENSANWSCGAIPNATTDVTIPTGITNYPVINSAAICRKIKQQSATSVLVKTGFSLKVVGTTTW